MSSSTALLPRDNQNKDEHPIFLRVCHSPWTTISQSHLVFIRFLIAAYLIVSFSYVLDYDINTLHHDWLVSFEFSNIIYLIQTLYAIITFVWTFWHLHYPHGNDEDDSNNATARIHKVFSPPRQSQDSNTRFYFSLFYTAAVVYPFVVSFIYWALLVPKGKSVVPGDQTFGYGRDTEFFVVAKYIVNAIIALIELYFLSSIRRSTPVQGHVIGLTFLSLAYVGWAFVGYVVTDQYAYYFFDHNELGWKYVIASIVAFVALSDVVFAFTYGITGLREASTTKCDNKRSYQILPQ